MTKEEYARNLYQSYIEWYSMHGEKDAFTYMLGVAMGMHLGTRDQHMYTVVSGLGKLTHIERLDRLRSFF